MFSHRSLGPGGSGGTLIFLDVDYSISIYSGNGVLLSIDIHNA